MGISRVKGVKTNEKVTSYKYAGLPGQVFYPVKSYMKRRDGTGRKIICCICPGRGLRTPAKA